MFFPTTLLLAALASMVSSAALPVPAAQPAEAAQLETRQSQSAIRFYTSKDYAGQWAEYTPAEEGVCESLPSSVHDAISSIRMGVYKCRFFGNQQCTGANQWFDSDVSNLHADGAYGYKGTQNDELDSAMCWVDS